LIVLLSSLALALSPARADLGEMGSLEQEQAQEKVELQDMKGEMEDIKKTMSEAAQAMSQASAQVSQSQAQIKEFHLTARETPWEICPGVVVPAIAYNGQVPGPVIRVQEGDPVRIVLHNQLKVPTSLYFHGLVLPHSVDGLPRRQAGLIAPGDTFAYQFVASRAGTFWYHPQVIHTNQLFEGLSGVLVVEPRTLARAYTTDHVLVIERWEGSVPGQAQPARGKATRTPDKSAHRDTTAAEPLAKTSARNVSYFTINGKTAPAIPAIEVKKGDRVRLRLVNSSPDACPIYLTGHRFEVIAVNGSEKEDINPRRDVITMQPGDRYDLEFIADNPGVWSLSSLLPEQSSNDGKFPGGLACVVRYSE
jgi:FtsP/CotA-like multicopper oxidase with cupredoxin domain